jgi:oxygen-independent coproporphyrinogen-3 oxidase
MQNFDTWDRYAESIQRGSLPLSRAYRPDADERLIRELVLQFKRGSIRPEYFHEKYGVEIRKRFAAPLASLSAEGLLAAADDDRIALTREALLRVDTLLHRFFL